MKAIFAAAILAIATPAIAAPSAMEQYKSQLQRAGRNVDLAQNAVMCGIRSQRWFEVFQDGYQLLATSEARRLGLGSAGLDAADEMAKAPPARMPCAQLVNSPTMDKLDRIQDVLTGGFR